MTNGSHTLTPEQQTEMRDMTGHQYVAVQTAGHGPLTIRLSDGTMIPNNRRNRRRLRSTR